MTEPDPLHRLERLEGYLLVDPANPRLLGDAFDLALSAAAWDRAEFHLRHALALGIERSDWLLREGQWLIAQKRWQEAEEHLLNAASHIQGSSALAATLAHDLAYVELHLGEHEAAIARLSPFVEFEPAQSDAVAALEALWLRVLHSARSLTRAMEWLMARERHAPPGPPRAALRWSERLRPSEGWLHSHLRRAR